MAMKCPKCGKETPEGAYYCGWCNATLRETALPIDSPTNSSESGPPTQMVFLIKNRLLRICVMISGITLAIGGIGFAIFGAYAMYRGSSLVYTINGNIVNFGEFAQATLAIGLVLMFSGFILRYVYRKEKPAQAE